MALLKDHVSMLASIIEFYKLNHQTDEQKLPVLLMHGSHGSGKTRIVETVSSDLGLNLCQVNAVTLAGESALAVEKRIEIFLNDSVARGPSLILIKSFHFLFKLKDINECNKRIVSTFFKLIQKLKEQQVQSGADADAKSWFFVVCTTNSKQTIDSNVVSNFNFDLEITHLSDEQRLEFANERMADFNLSEAEKALFLKKTKGLFYGEMQTFYEFLLLERSLDPAKFSERFERYFGEYFGESTAVKDVEEEDHETRPSNETCIGEAFKKFASKKKFQQENKLNIDETKWDDVGGLAQIKDLILDTIQLPLKYPLLFKTTDQQLGIARSGILFYGPPGTGKTLLAKAICNECDLNFLSVKGPELLDMYVGQTELNIRNLFEKARMNSPCILFFDELDSLAPVRGRSGDSGGVMDRVVSQLLTEVDGLDKYNSKSSGEPAQIFLIGATNRPDLIDPSLLRPGRFDKLVYVPIAKEPNERLGIFNALIRKLPIEENFNAEDFIKKCPLNLTGADFYSITNKARKNALRRLIELSESSKERGLDENAIFVGEEDFTNALVDFQPTLNERSLEEYELYFQKYSNKQQS